MECCTARRRSTDRADVDAGDAESRRPAVAGETDARALEDGLSRGTRGHGIEDRAELGIDSRELDDVADIAARTSDGIAAALASYSKAELFEMAQRDKLLMVPVTTPADVVQSEHYEAREFWDDVDVGRDGLEGPVRFPGPT